MRLKPFLLDAWLDTYEHGIEFNLAASTGPTWTANELLDLGGEESRQRYLNHKVVYGRPAGADSLREAIAEMQGVSVDHVQVVTDAPRKPWSCLCGLPPSPEPTSSCRSRALRRSRRFPSRSAS